MTVSEKRDRRAGRPAWWVGLLALTVFTACSSTEDSSVAGTGAETPQRGGTLVIGSISGVDIWNEYVSRHAFTLSLLRRVYLRLADVQGDDHDHPATYLPSLAESWEVSEDGLSLTFRLRQANWSDGEPITADDVRYTWQAQTSRHSTWVGLASKRRIREVEAVDDRTVVFHFESSYPFQFSDAVEGGILPEHVFGKIPFEDWNTTDWSETKVGSGPFLLESLSTGLEIVLKRNESYYDAGRPLLDRVVVRVVPDATQLATNLRTGQIDYTENLTPRDARSFADDPQVSLVPFDYPGTEFIGWNGSRPPFVDPRLRRAMTLAIDREALVEDLLYGYGRVARGPMLSFWWSAHRGLEPWPHDPERARAILQELGYDTSDSGGNRALRLELMTRSGSVLREQMAVKVQEQLSRIGVRVDVRTVEGRTLGGKIENGDYDAFLMGLVYGIPDLESMFGSGFVPPAGGNYTFYRSEAVDRLLKDLDGADQWTEMKPILDSIQEHLHEDQPFTFLYETQRVAAHRNRLRGVLVDIPIDPLARLDRYWLATP